MNTTTLVIILVLATASLIGFAMKVMHMQGKLKLPKMPKLSSGAAKPSKAHWWQSETAVTLGLVTLGLIAINVLCSKVGFAGWRNIYKYESFLWLNMFLLLAVFLTLVAKKPVVKWVAGLIALIILVGGGRIWFDSTSPVSELATRQQSVQMVEIRYTVKSGEVSKSLICDDIVSWTDSPVYLRFNGAGDWKPWEHPGQKVPADTNTIEIKADMADIIVVVREPRPSA